jgi:hypothetical protein
MQQYLIINLSLNRGFSVRSKFKKLMNLHSNWQERLFFERLERKSKPIFDLLEQTNHDWEAVLFCLLAKNFGLNTNGEIF